MKYGIIIVALFCALISKAQQLNIPLNHTMNIGWERVIADSDSLSFHSGFKPLIENSIIDYGKFQEYHKTQLKKHFAWFFKDSNWLKRKFKWENLFEKKGEDFYFDVNPLFYLEYGRDLANDNSMKFFKNGRGVIVNGHLTEKVSFSTSFMENQMYLPTYLRNYSDAISSQYFNGAVLRPESPIVPGQGRVKRYGTLNRQYDFAYAQGYVSYSPTSTMNFQFGNGKLFVGDGYRSVLLSDNSFSFPHLRFTGSFLNGRMQYTVVHAALQNMIRMREFSSPEGLFEKKAASFMYLSFQVNKKLQLGLFEGAMHRRHSDDQKLLPVDVFNLQPLIGLNLIRRGFLNENGNVLLGANFKYKPFRKSYFYGQLATDDPSNGRWAYQIGAKWFDAFKTKNLFFQLEIDHTAKAFYTGLSGRVNYAHYNQPLALTGGGGTFETIFRGYYRTDDYFYEIRFHYQTYRSYSGPNQVGKDVFLPSDAYSDPSITSAMAHLFYRDISFGYILNPLYNMHLLIGWFHRDLRSVEAPYKTSYLYIGFRTSLSNFYYDI